MKSLIISIISIAVVLAGWGAFVNYSDKSIHKLMNSIEDDILVNVDAQEWARAEKQYDKLSKDWHKQKNIYTFFFNTKEINETDYTIARAEYYIKERNVALASGELNCVQEQLKFMHLNELITLDNIF